MGPSQEGCTRPGDKHSELCILEIPAGPAGPLERLVVCLGNGMNTRENRADHKGHG
jgi:hypothetical protein